MKRFLQRSLWVVLGFFAYPVLQIAFTAAGLNTVSASDEPQFDSAKLGQIEPGAKVSIRGRTYRTGDAESRTDWMGEVLQVFKEGVALKNVTVESRRLERPPLLLRMPYISRFFKNTGVAVPVVPVAWVSVDEMQDIEVFQPAPPGFEPPALNLRRPGFGLDFEL